MALTKEAVVENALKIGDTEGLGAVTIRRLAQELGVTPMALYWHFKNKDQLFLGMIDELMAESCVDLDTHPWQAGLRRQAGALLGSLRAHPYLPELLHTTDKLCSANFARATEIALTFLARGGFSPIRANQVASYLLHGLSALVDNQPCPPVWQHVDPDTWQRSIQRDLHLYAKADFPQLNAFATALNSEVDLEDYYTFGLDLLMAAIETMASRTSSRQA